MAAASRTEYTPAEQTAILIWELDWRSERESIIEDAIVQEQAMN